MEADNNSEIQPLTPEEYHKRADEFYVAGNVDDFLGFQRTHSILYADPIPKQDKEILKNMDISEILDDIELI